MSRYKVFLASYYGLGLALLPLFYWPNHPVVYEVPKVMVFQWWVRGLVLLAFIGAWWHKPGQINLKLVGLMAGFLILALLASIMGADIQKSVVGNYYRQDGLLTLFHLMAMSVVVMVYWSKVWRKWSVGGIAAGVILVSIWAVWSGVRYFLLGDISASYWGGAIGVSFGQPNFLAGYLLVTLPWVVYRVALVKRSSLRVLGWLGAGFAQVAIGLTGSWVALGLSLAFWVAYCWQLRLRYRKLVGIVGILGAFLLLNAFILTMPRGFVAESRGRIWRQTFSGSIQRPLTGYGMANVDAAFEAGNWPVEFEDDIYLDKAHMLLLELLATTGIVGLVLYIALVVVVARLLWQHYQSRNERHWWWATGMVFGLYLLHSQTNVMSISEEMVFWLVVGIVGAKSE